MCRAKQRPAVPPAPADPGPPTVPTLPNPPAGPPAPGSSCRPRDSQPPRPSPRRTAPPSAISAPAACPDTRAPLPSSAIRAGFPLRLRPLDSAAATLPAPRRRPRSTTPASGTRLPADALGSPQTLLAIPWVRSRSHPFTRTLLNIDERARASVTTARGFSQGPASETSARTPSYILHKTVTLSRPHSSSPWTAKPVKQGEFIVNQSCSRRRP